MAIALLASVVVGCEVANRRASHGAVSAGLAFRRWSHCSCSGDLSLPPPQKVRRLQSEAMAAGGSLLHVLRVP